MQDKWRKAPDTEADRRRIYSNLLSRARKQFMNENFGAIWKRHVEEGLIVRCHGCEANNTMAIKLLFVMLAKYLREERLV